MIEIDDVRAAAARIDQYIHKTPVLTSEQLNDIVDADLHFKCENLQKAGAFKARGAMNAVMSLSQDEASRGVATHSSGNHGAALARAAKIRDIPAYIVVPENANNLKKAAIGHYGAEIIECESTLAAREATLQATVEETGAYFVHPYDDDLIIAGQGTAALELLDQVYGLDMVVAPVGGGGMVCGTATVCHPSIQVFAAEPEGADDAYRSLESGTLVTEQVPNTICDGLLTTIGERNFEIMKAKVAGVLLASDQEVADAMRLIWTRMKMIIEPSSAIALAAVIRNPEVFSGKRVGLMMTGGNVDPSKLPF